MGSALMRAQAAGEVEAVPKAEKIPGGASGRGWQKGVSGNPGGRLKQPAKVTDLARSLCEEAVLGLAALARDPKMPAPTRLAAWNSILDRGMGKPIQAVDLTASVRRDITEWSTEELEALTAAGLAAASGVVGVGTEEEGAI